MKAKTHISRRGWVRLAPGGRFGCWLGMAFVLGVLVGARAQDADSLDTLFMLRGEKTLGHLIGLDKTIYRLEKPLPPPPNAPSGAPAIIATVTLPRAGVDSIVFAPDSQRDNVLKSATGDDLAQVSAWWERAEPWLGVARSPAARIGLVYGDLLLRAGRVAEARKALAVFRKIEAEAWNPQDVMGAQQGRLRAMVATGRAQEAVQEALELAKISEDPSVLMEAKFVLASAADKELRQLVEENPRWTEDVFVLPERNRLYNKALDLYLYPGLFAGAESQTAARGIWGAVGIYQFSEEWPAAVELCRDLVAIHPRTKYASLAKKFLDRLPAKAKKHDAEQDACEEIKDSPSPQSHEK